MTAAAAAAAVHAATADATGEEETSPDTNFSGRLPRQSKRTGRAASLKAADCHLMLQLCEVPGILHSDRTIMAYVQIGPEGSEQQLLLLQSRGVEPVCTVALQPYYVSPDAAEHSCSHIHGE